MSVESWSLYRVCLLGLCRDIEVVDADFVEFRGCRCIDLVSVETLLNCYFVEYRGCRCIEVRI